MVLSAMAYLLILLFLPTLFAADLENSKDPPGMKRYAGSEIIGYRQPKFDEYVLPLGVPTGSNPPTYTKSQPVDGLVGRTTYVAPAGRTPTEVMRNYKLEFQRMGLDTIYDKKPTDSGWFGPSFDKIAEDDDLGQILEYNEPDERLIVGKSHDPKPTYYVVFVTSYKDGVIPERLQAQVQKARALAVVITVVPEVMEKNMAFVNAEEMKGAMTETGKVVLYGIYFDSDKDVVKPESKPTLNEIARLMKASPAIRVHIVGHTDNQGKPDYNLDLSRRRAAAVSRELTGKYAIAADRLDSFGCGLYSPLASNATEEGRTKNRRVELVQ